MLMSKDWPQKQMLTLRLRQKFSALELIEWERAWDQEKKIASRGQKEATFRQLHAHCHVSMSVRGRYFCLLSAGHLNVITVTPLSLAKKACPCVCAWSTTCAGVKGLCWTRFNWSASVRQLDSSKMTGSSALNRKAERNDNKVMIATRPMVTITFLRPHCFLDLWVAKTDCGCGDRHRGCVGCSHCPWFKDCHDFVIICYFSY